MILDQLHKVNDIKKLDESQVEQLRDEVDAVKKMYK